MYSNFSEILQKKGVSVYRMCKETGISQSTITHWKNGNYVPKIDKLIKIADYLGVSVEMLTGNSETHACNKPIKLTVGAENEFPELNIRNGDTIIIEHFSELKNDSLYAFYIDEFLKIKRLYLTDCNIVILVSNGKATAIPLSELPTPVGVVTGVEWKK